MQHAFYVFNAPNPLKKKAFLIHESIKNLACVFSY